MPQLFLDQASSYAHEIDNLIWIIAAAVGFWFIVAEAVFFGFILKYRAKPGQRAAYIEGTERKYTRFISYPHMIIILFDVVLIAGSIRVWYLVKQQLPDADRTIRVIGQQWAWTFVHPGADGELDTDDDIRMVDELHVQVGDTYHFQLTSTDVLHSFSVPVFRLKQDAVPGRTITGWFQPTRTGEYDIQCAEICGIGHGIMAAKLFIESPEDHAAWIAAHNPTASLQ
ncbi:MAG: cytochrome C oxidase subunit II [Deltaproteobacteria bacterium]|nr:MAG: cytochrome C oxidase subunit II [Deltaproteobacteria bacterium]